MELKAVRREKTGKAVRSLRHQGTLPAVVYGKGFENLNLSLDLKEFKKVFKEAGHTTIVDLTVEGEKEPLKILIADVQEEPIKNEYIHADLRQVNLSQKISAEIPVITIGQSPAVVGGEGILLTLLTKIKVEALPLDLPHKINFDLSSLKKIGDGLTVKDLPLDQSKVQILENNPDDLVVKIDYAVQIEKEEEVKSVEDIEVLKEKKEEEGTEGAESTGTGDRVKEAKSEKKEKTEEKK